MTYAVLAVWVAAGMLAAAPSADTSPAHIARDATGVVLSWQSGMRMVSARIAPSAAWSLGQVACCATGTNTLFAAWEEISPDGTDTDLYAQHFGADGAPRWMPRGIVAIKFPGHQRIPAVAADERGAYVVWQSDSAGIKNNNIWCQRIEPDGRAAWATPAPVCTAPGDQTHAAIASEPDGQGIIAWEDRREVTLIYTASG